MRIATQQKIEAAALSLFARKGLSVKIGEIAEAAGISQGLLYSHYPSKDALIAELVRQATDISSKSILDFAQDDGTAAEKVRAVSSVMCGMFAEAHIGIGYFMFMIQVGMSGFVISDALYSDERPNPVESLAKIIAQGQAEGSIVDGDATMLSVTYWAVIQGLCCYAITGIPVSPDPRMLNRIILKEDFI